MGRKYFPWNNQIAPALYGVQLRCGFVIEGELEQRMAAFQIEFLADIGAVVFNRPVADEEFTGNLFDGWSSEIKTRISGFIGQGSSTGARG
jgi:hypothetical protein